MKSSSDCILLSGINPFDKSYHSLQQTFDRNVVDIVTGMLNLNVNLVTTPLVTDFGSYENDPDSWVVEQIVNGSAEISSTTIVLSPDSPNAVSYSFGIGPFRPQLYYRARSLREDSNIYLTPFTPELWLCLMAVAFLLIAGLTFILSREAKLPHEISYDVLARIIDVQQDKDEDFVPDVKTTPKELLLKKEKWEMGEILLVCLGAPCQQGSARDPSTNAARIIILCMFVLALVGYTAYSASLISLVSLFPSTEREQTRDVQHFSSQYETLLLGIRKVNDLHLDFTETEFANLKKGFQKVLQGKAVFLGDRDISLTFLHRQKYDASIRCTLGRTFLGLEYQRVFVLKKDSPLKETINRSILSLQQFGLLNRERRKIFNTEPPCTIREKLLTSNFVSFNKEDVTPVLKLYIYGIATSLLLLLIENVLFLCPNDGHKFLRKLPIRGNHKMKQRV